MTETNLPATLPVNGNLPATYEAARHALTECSRVDECKGWADKAAALASYARQAKDDSLLRLAQRIQLRAVNRCGELLKQIPRGDEATRYGQAATDPPGKVGAYPPVTRTQAASEAGLSDRQRKNALRVANVPRDEFEEAVESESPPTVAALAARGTVARQIAPDSVPPTADHATVAQANALLRQFAAFCSAHEPVSIARAPGADADVLRGYVAAIDRWLDRFVTNLRAEDAAA
jgi:hypothetical protein